MERRRKALITLVSLIAASMALVGVGVAVLFEETKPALAIGAYEGCLELGMSPAQIETDEDECLERYWTPERLEHTGALMFDWANEAGGHSGIDEGTDGRLMSFGEKPQDVPPFPDHTDTRWWDRQAQKRPDRTMTREKSWGCHDPGFGECRTISRDLLYR